MAKYDNVTDAQFLRALAADTGYAFRHRHTAYERGTFVEVVGDWYLCGAQWSGSQRIRQSQVDRLLDAGFVREVVVVSTSSADKALKLTDKGREQADADAVAAALRTMSGPVCFACGGDGHGEANGVSVRCLTCGGSGKRTRYTDV